MSNQKKENSKESKNNENNKKILSIILKSISILILSIFMLGSLVTGIFATTFIDIVKDTPVVDPSKMNELMIQSSVILDKDDQLVEKIENLENRTIVDLKDIPQHLIDAFISTEDERFYKHKGVDPIGITKSFFDTVIGGRLRGGSTIAQQLARNMYLSSEQKMERKIKEAYLALQITDTIKRDGVLEAYLNRVFLGQHSYGVQAASQGYFSKNVSDITIAQSALLAAIVQSPTRYSLYKTIKPEYVDDESAVISELNISGQVYKAVYNPKVIDRQKYVLKKMYELKKITKEQYEQALAEDVFASIKPNYGSKRPVSTYFTDLVKNQVAEKLMTKYNYSKEDAWDKIYNGGLTIHSTMDQKMQKNIEDLYKDFSNILNAPKKGAPAFSSFSKDKSGNIVNQNGTVIYYTRKNLISDSNEIIVPEGEYSITDDGSIKINSNRIWTYNNVIGVSSFYSISDDNNLVTHDIGSFQLPEESTTVENSHSFTLNADIFKDYKDFYTINDNNSLILSSKYFPIDEVGTLQPQSSTVVIDQTKGHIVAIIGGRETTGNPLNRAYKIPRQPGSTIKTLSVYTPALDNGYTAASPIDDVPHYNEKHELWPRNWYNGYKGLQSLRNSLVQSINVNAVKVLEDIGLDKSKEYLKKFGLINQNNELDDTFVSKSEDLDHNDENLSSMALGALTKGVTNLQMTAAYSSIANKGTYIEPITFTKVLDSTGEVVLEADQKEHSVTSPENAFILTSILSDIPKVLAPAARHKTIDTAGKTGTTQDIQDSWFVGFTPYYTIGTWIGFDNYGIKLSKENTLAAHLWGKVNNVVLEGLDPKHFDNPPENIIQRYVSSKTGLLASEGATDAVNEYFVKGTEPTTYDNSYIVVKIDKRNGKLANETTPIEFIEEKRFFVRPTKYDPNTNNGIVPEDFVEGPPTEVSDIIDEVPATPIVPEVNNENGEVEVVDPNNPNNTNKPNDDNNPNEDTKPKSNQKPNKPKDNNGNTSDDTNTP